MTWNAQIISHTHWDREWYLNSPYTNEWLVPFFDQLFKMFEKEEAYQFVLDGQMAMIDDYFEELAKGNRPVYKYRNKIRKYVQEGRLFIGPYYLQPDWQLLSEEALVRNLLIGHKKASEYGKCMHVGWLLDNFGQISQTAQIHKECDIQGLYVWRGVEMDPRQVRSEFIWEAPDGTRMPSVYLLNSYRNVMRLAEYAEIMKRRIYDEVDKLQDFMTTSNMLMMNGYDQEMVPDDIQPYIKTKELDTEHIKVTQSNPERYLASVLEEEPDLMTLQGALYSGRFIAVFPGVMSSRMYLKLQNDASQKAIEHHAEPLSMLDYFLGGDYEASVLDRAWELLLKNHPHDSICGVSIDDVHQDMENRTRDFHFLMDHQIRKAVMHLAKRINTKHLEDENYFVYNPSPYPRSEVISINGENYYMDHIEPFGYTHVKKKQVVGSIIKEDNHLENNKIKVIINPNGTFDLYHKATNRWYVGLGMLEDKGDAGDEYNYSYPDTDKSYYSTDSNVTITDLMVTPEKVQVEIRFDMDLPIGITKDRKKRNHERMNMPVRQVVTMEANSEVIKVKTAIRNTVKDHRVRALFPTDITADYTYAGSPFDVVKRPIHMDDYDEAMIPDNVKRVIVGAREAKPNTTFLGRELIDINDGEKGLAILSKGLPEYTVYQDKNTIALTLFRSVGWIAKDINTRIGDAGPEIFTPEAQCLREMSFEYAVYPHEKHYDKGNVLREADRFNHDLLTFVTDKHDGSLSPSQSFMKVDDPKHVVRVTSIKRSEDGNGIIIRLYNGSDQVTHVTIASAFHIRNAYRTNFLEQQKQASTLSVHNNTFELKVGKKAIETIYIQVTVDTIDMNQEAYVDIYENEEPYDFSNYAYVPRVTEEDIASELKRADKLKDGLHNPMLRRTALEAKLSAILTSDRYHETQIHKLGYQLNEARVSRRVHDYIKDIH